MKKILFFILILVLTVSSCNFLMKDEYGELVLSFDGTLPDGSRALDSNGLPVLASSRMEIKISGESGSLIIKNLKADEPKSLVELVPIGEKIEISVTAYNPSAQWSGKKTHTVTSGQNRVTVLLNKKASGLNKILFTQKMIKHDGHNEYRLNLYLDGKEINFIQSQDPYVFARDSKGRFYIRYDSASPEIHRYTSEGEYDGKTSDSNPDDTFFGNDYKTGKMYKNIEGGLARIEENLRVLPVTSGYEGYLFAVDNGRVISENWNDMGFVLSNIGTTTQNRVTSEVIRPYAEQFGLKSHDRWKIKDLFIRGDHLYILFSRVQQTPESTNNAVYSLGAVLKWKLGEKTVPAPAGSSVLPNLVGEPVLIGKPAGSLPIENQVLPSSYYANNFYGAVKVIGFDDENLYIADDGFDAADTPAGVRIVKNRNRIGVLNMNTNALTFTDAGPAKWYDEWKEWKGVNTKAIVWDTEYKDLTGDLEKTTFKEHGSSDEFFDTESNEDGLFTFDQSGVLYIPYYDNDESKNKIKRFVQDDDGTYEDEAEFPLSSNFPGSMAVDISRSHRYAAQVPGGSSEMAYYNVLYCSGSNNINRFVWTDNFTAAFKDDSYNVQGEGWKITALAANKDGLFVALWKRDSVTYTYGIKIKRYDKVSGAFSGTVVLVPEETSEIAGDFSIHEKITDMHIQDGVLYAVTRKKMDERSGKERLFTFGKLWYVSTTADFGDNKRVLYASSEETSGPDTKDKNFTPRRFIAIKPKKLVIASDGYYGEKREGDGIVVKTDNFDKVFTFNIGSWANPGQEITDVEFTAYLTTCSPNQYFPFDLP